MTDQTPDTATALRAALSRKGMPAEDTAAFVEGFAHSHLIAEDGTVDAPAVDAFADDVFRWAGQTPRKPRDFGAGDRATDVSAGPGRHGAAEATRRFGDGPQSHQSASTNAKGPSFRSAEAARRFAPKKS